MRLGEPVVQLGGVARDRDDEDQVEEQLERRRGPVPLAGVARDHGTAQRNRDDAHEPSMPPGQLREVRLARPTPTSTGPDAEQRERRQEQAQQVGSGLREVVEGHDERGVVDGDAGGAGVRLAATGRGDVDQGRARCGRDGDLDGQRGGGVVDHHGVGVLAGDGRRHDAARPAGPEALTGVIPSGSGSVTTIGAVVSLGPSLVTMIRNVARPSDWAVSSLSTTRALSPSTGAMSVAALFSGLVSSAGDVTVAVLTTDG